MQVVNTQNTTNLHTSKKQINNDFTNHSQVHDQSPLSFTEQLVVKELIEKNWRPPMGLAKLSEVRVLLHIELKQNGEIKNIIVNDVICPLDAHSTCKLIEESAVRAINRSSPIVGLPIDRYNVWKEFDLVFDPSFIVQ